MKVGAALLVKLMETAKVKVDGQMVDAFVHGYVFQFPRRFGVLRCHEEVDASFNQWQWGRVYLYCALLSHCMSCDRYIRSFLTEIWCAMLRIPATFRWWSRRNRGRTTTMGVT